MVLFTFSTNVFFYKKYNKEYKKRIYFKQINLLDYKQITVTQNKRSGFKHKLSFGNESNISLSFKKNNERQEWFAHFDFIISHKANPFSIVDENYQIQNTDEKSGIENQDQDENENKYTRNESFRSLQLLLHVLKNYERYLKENKNNNLKLRLNVSYSDLLNHFNNVITYFHSNKIDEGKQVPESQHCTETECKYINRYQIQRRQNKRTRKPNIFVHELLDKIHCFIFHRKSETNSVVRPNLKTKFVITTQTQTNEKIEEKNTNDHDENISLFNRVTNSCEEKDTIKDAQYQNDSNTSSLDTNIRPRSELVESNSQSEEKLSDKDQNSLFAFGEVLNHWEEKAKNLVKIHYLTLKEELTSNPYCTITTEEYYEYYMKALNTKMTKRFRNMKAIKCGSYNKKNGIDVNDNISINHIIALMTYCNEDELQRIFKQQTRKSEKKESRNSVYHKASFIAHWIRYLNESCTFFGEQMKSNQFVYCGIDRKLIFNSFDIYNHSPLSTSSQITVANSFATNNGIILKLKAHVVNSRYFDMAFISDYVNERELFFCGISHLSISDIIISGQSNVYKVSALTLLQSILSGSLFVYKFNKLLLNKHTKDGLVDLLDNYTSENAVVNNDYFMQLTAALLQSYLNRNSENDPFGFKMIFINTPQIKKLNHEALSAYFLLPSSPLIQNFNTSKIDPIYINNAIKFKLDNEQLNQLQMLRPDQDDKIILGNFFVKKYRFQCWIDKRCISTIDWLYVCVAIEFNDLRRLNGLYCVDMILDIVCEQLSYQHVQMPRSLNPQNEYFAGNKVFPCSDIDGLDNMSIDLNVKITSMEKIQLKRAAPSKMKQIFGM
eukprot:448730_1